jgi:hypothetical protein
VTNVDEPRFLAKGLGYVRSGEIAMDKVEAVSEDEQRRQTRARRLAWQREMKRAWGTCHATITGALQDFEAQRPADRAIAEAVRSLERSVVRVDRRIDQLGRQLEA